MKTILKNSIINSLMAIVTASIAMLQMYGIWILFKDFIFPDFEYSWILLTMITITLIMFEIEIVLFFYKRYSKG